MLTSAAVPDGRLWRGHDGATTNRRARAARRRRQPSTPRSRPRGRPRVPRVRAMRRSRSSCTTSSPHRRSARPIRSCGSAPDRFVHTMQALARAGYHATTLGAVWRAWHGHGTMPRHPIMVSFDDGYQSQSTVARLELDRLGWPGVLNLEVDNVRLKGGLARAEVRRHAARRLGDRCPHAHPSRPHHGRPRAAGPRGGGLATVAAPCVRRARSPSSAYPAGPLRPARRGRGPQPRATTRRPRPRPASPRCTRIPTPCRA